MNKFQKALLASVALYITFFVALIVVNPFPVNNFTFVGDEPGKYQFMPSNSVAVTLKSFDSKTFDKNAIGLTKNYEN